MPIVGLWSPPRILHTKPTASFAGWPAKVTDVANRSVVAPDQTGSALVEVPILVVEPPCRALHDQPNRELRQTIEHLAHEQGEALWAITNYLGGAIKLLERNIPNGKCELDKAIAKAMEQTARASEIVRRLRFTAR